MADTVIQRGSKPGPERRPGGGKAVAPAQRPVISLRGIRKTYKSATGEVVEVLKGLDLDIAPGSFNVIRGESGSGKTSLLRILGMLDSEFEGTYLFGEDDVRDQSDWYRDELRSNNIGFIFQDGRLFNHMPVRDNIALPVRLQGTTRDRRALPQTIADLAPQFFTRNELDNNILRNRPQQVSGGQKQRASIMRAVIHRPAVILADEPTASLDESRKQEVLNLLKKLCEDGHTVIVVSHDKVFYNAGRQLELSKGVLKELAADNRAQPPKFEIRRPAAGPSILYGWRPRAPLSILIRQAARETFMRPIFLFLILISLCVGVTQVGVFSSVIVGAQTFIEDTMTKGSRLNRLEFKPRHAEFGAKTKFPQAEEIKTWPNVQSLLARRSASWNVWDYTSDPPRASLFDVKGLWDNDPEYPLLDFVAGGPFTPGEDELQAIIPQYMVPVLFADGKDVTTGARQYQDFVGKPITIFIRKFAPTNLDGMPQTVSWTAINIRVVGIVLYAEGGGQVLYAPIKTMLAFDKYVQDREGKVGRLPLAGHTWTDIELATFQKGVPKPSKLPEGAKLPPVLSGGDAWTDKAQVAAVIKDFAWEDKLQVYATAIREIIPVFRQLSKLGFEVRSDIFEKNMKWVLDIQDLAWNIFLPLLALIVLAVALTVATNIFSSAKLRETELALWRILGMRRGDLVATQVISTIFMVLAGTVVGILIASGLVDGARTFLVAQKESATDNFDKVFAPVSDFLLPLLLASLLVGLLSAIYPSVRTAHADPAKVLQS